MIGINAYVLVKYLVKDDDHDFLLVKEALAEVIKNESCILITLFVLIQTERILSNIYRFPKDDIINAFAEIISIREIEIDDAGTLEDALRLWYSNEKSFLDYLILAKNARVSGQPILAF